MRDTDLGELIELTYAAGTDASRWPAFLERLRRVLNARIVGLFVHDMGTHNGMFSFNLGLAPDHVRLYDQYYCERNVWMIHAREQNVPGNVRTSEERFPHAELVKTEFYNDFLRPVGVAHGVGGTILKDGPRVGNITVLRAKGAFGDEARRVLSTVIPHLRHAIRTHRRLAGTRLEEHAVMAALDRLPSGVLIVDGASRPIFVNAEGRRILAARDGLTIERRMLSASRSDDTRRLRELVARAAARGGGGGSLALGRPSARRPFGVEVVALALPAGDGMTSRVVGIFIVDPERRAENDEHLLARLYGLTPAEAGLAARLAAGESLLEAAGQRGFGHETARTHLKRILRKTGARRQAELVLRFRAGALRISGGEGRPSSRP